MGRRKFNIITISFVTVIALVVVLLLVNSLRRSSHIVLPEDASSAESSGKVQQDQDDNLIDITPRSVQTAISSLNRSTKYVRSLSVENIWSGGSTSFTTTVAVYGDYMRSDTKNGGRTRHVITDGKTTYVWYNQSKNCYIGSSGDISADQEQRIPTYEDILNLNVKQISKADYRTFSNENCIYVETAKDDDGYVQRYWVSAASGLLTGAEKLKDGEKVYQMSAQTVAGTSPATSDFTLPDGTVLCKVGS